LVIATVHFKTTWSPKFLSRPDSYRDFGNSKELIGAAKIGSMKELLEAFLKNFLIPYCHNFPKTIIKFPTKVVNKNNAVDKNLLYQIIHDLEGRLIFAVQTVLKR
jgi:hypothetical protein